MISEPTKAPKIVPTPPAKLVLDASKPRVYPDATVNTLWGELAYQLGGLEGYRMVEQADVKGVSPGSNTLSELLYHFEPCLIVHRRAGGLRP